jgi:hypothetical protein
MPTESQQELSRRYAKLIARAWSDAAFKAQLMSDPRSAFGEYNIQIPEGQKVKVVEDTGDTTHFILPPPPTSAADLHMQPLEFGPASAGPVAWACSRCGVCLSLAKTEE